MRGCFHSRIEAVDCQDQRKAVLRNEVRGFARLKSNWHARRNGADPDHHKSTRTSMDSSESSAWVMAVLTGS